MTNKLKCPFCQHNLRKLFNRYTGEPNCDYECGNHNCDLYGIEMPETVWQALTQVKEDLKDCQHNYSVKSEQHERGYACATKTIKDLESKLEIATNALESISGIRGNIEDYYGGVSIHYQQMVLHMDEIATNALEQIKQGNYRANSKK